MTPGGAHGDSLPFAACLGFMLLQHILNPVAFVVKLPPEEYPIRSAFFLPIVQLHRFVSGIIKTGSCTSVSETEESVEAEALYAVMSAIETGPQLIIQFAVLTYFSLEDTRLRGYPDYHPKIIPEISIVASFLSMAYNTGRAVMYQMSKRWTFTLNTAGIAGGLCTFSALLLRCTTISSIIITYIFFWLFLGLYWVVGVLPVSYINGMLLVFMLKWEKYVWSWAAQLEVMVAAYISMIIGPLYAVLEGYNGRYLDRNYNSKQTLATYLALATGINFLPDFVFLTILTIQKNTVCYQQSAAPVSGDIKHLHWSSSVFTCSHFKAYIALGVALTVLSCIILVLLSNVSADEQRKAKNQTKTVQVHVSQQTV
ncbi:hypothetical protein M758_3G089600 [Ceratodon purpureus]|nr:hypothetical protein M758_3G089600 [Ceratodon purpureus]